MVMLLRTPHHWIVLISGGSVASKVSMYCLKSGNQGFNGSKLAVDAATSAISSSSSLLTSRMSFLRPPVLLFLTAGCDGGVSLFSLRYWSLNYMYYASASVGLSHAQLDQPLLQHKLQLRHAGLQASSF